MGVLKTKIIITFWQHPLSWLFHIPTQKSNPSPIFKIPNKIKQNPKFPISNPLSYPISLKSTNQATFTHFTTQKSNFHFIKNSLTNPKLSLFISTFTDNLFNPESIIIINHINHKSLIYNTQGYIKTTSEKPKITYIHHKNSKKKSNTNHQKILL